MTSYIEDIVIRVIQHKNMVEYEMKNLIAAIEARYETDQLLDTDALRARADQIRKEMELYRNHSPERIKWLELELNTMRSIWGGYDMGEEE